MTTKPQAPPPPAPAPTAKPLASGRPMLLMVKADGAGGFMAVAGASGFKTEDEAKGFADRLKELILELDATHRPPPQRN